MKMTRDQLRRLQDKVVSKLLKEGYETNDDVHGVYMPNGKTCKLSDLQKYLIEGYELEFIEYLKGR